VPVSKNEVDKHPGFWKRQFSNQVTRPQIAFDFVFGLLAPLLCVAADGIYNLGLFRSNGFLGGYFESFSIYCYSEIAIGIAALAYYLFFRRESGVLTGILFAGAAFSLLIGIVLFPVSVIGIVVVIGVLGFTPLLSSFVFFRNARRCWSRVGDYTPWKYRVAIIIFWAVLIVPAIPETSANLIIDPPRVESSG
jgi:hypothetical protein